MFLGRTRAQVFCSHEAPPTSLYRLFSAAGFRFPFWQTADGPFRQVESAVFSDEFLGQRKKIYEQRSGRGIESLLVEWADPSATFSKRCLGNGSVLIDGPLSCVASSHAAG